MVLISLAICIGVGLLVLLPIAYAPLALLTGLALPKWLTLAVGFILLSWCLGDRT